MNNACPTCKTPWNISKGPGRTVGPVANSILGVFAPIPDDFEFQYCAPCKKRNLTPELKGQLLGFERVYLERQ